MKTRAEMIEGLSVLQMERMNTEPSEKKYFYYHDSNCKLSTHTLKDRIRRELIWKLQMEEKRNGTTTKI